MRSIFFLVLTVFVLTVFVLTACSPRLDWREVQGNDAPYSVLLPAKPTRLSRQINLDGLPVNMAMTAAEVGGLTFAVGAVQLQNATQTPHALDAMKRAMISNIHGTIRPSTTKDGHDIEAVGEANGKPAVLYARFTARGLWVYQVVLLAREEAVAPETLDTFFGSFQPH